MASKTKDSVSGKDTPTKDVSVVKVVKTENRKDKSSRDIPEITIR